MSCIFLGHTGLFLVFNVTWALEILTRVSLNHTSISQKLKVRPNSSDLIGHRCTGLISNTGLPINQVKVGNVLFRLVNGLEHLVNVVSVATHGILRHLLGLHIINKTLNHFIDLL